MDDLTWPRTSQWLAVRGTTATQSAPSVMTLASAPTADCSSSSSSETPARQRGAS